MNPRNARATGEGIDRPRRHPWRALAVVAALAVTAAYPAERAALSTKPTVSTTVRSAAAATGQVTAHDGKFWLGAQQITLHGTNVRYPCCSSTEYARIASWGMNLNRLRFQWALLEPYPPVKNADGTWSHTYDQTYLNGFAADAARSAQAGLYVLVNPTGCTCTFFGDPDWQYQAPYNSKGKTYPQTAAGIQDGNTDFWGDARRQQFMTDALKQVALKLKSQSGVLGYEIMNEPTPGALPNAASTTDTMLDVQLRAAQAIRSVDPPRAIVFTTRFGYAPGVDLADLSGFRALGNVIFDAHDFFGARWGDGRYNKPDSPEYHERMQTMYVNVLPDDNVTPGYPYIGDTEGHVRWLQGFVDALDPWGIPLLVGEFGIRSDLTKGVYLYFGSTTSALNYVGVSWTLCEYNSPLGIVDPNGNLYPWAYIVLDAV
ncbi:MAG TPA: cellulase family glycosylhydrolase [Actinomycetota bacterium]|nr:cellulase family glycosylhydrolase [Actinomycetota bacterium]